jgi:MFS family permease
MGCGLGYIAPVSTLVKWFPDRRGMATGMAIMGFGGGAALASPLNVRFMNWLGVPTAVMTLGAIYFVVMMVGARILRRPPEGWKPAGWNPPEKTVQASITRNAALRTPQFYLLWSILFINVTAGIGILAQASPIVQDIFGQTAAEAANFVLLLSLFNLAGRFIWASSSDYLGRRNTYSLFFAVQFVLFLVVPGIAGRGEWALFETCLLVVVSMYGGGFATIPAFLADLFGADNVGAIHGAVLTAWSAAAIAGPVIVTELSNRAKAGLGPGASHVHIYDSPLQVLAGLLAVGFLITLLVRPLRRY